MQDETVTRARELRRDCSRAERICWEFLRSRRLNGVKFRRQHPIGSYFADFACVSKKLVVEIDGEHRAYQTERDARWAAALERDRNCNNRAVPPHPTSAPRGEERSMSLGQLDWTVL